MAAPVPSRRIGTEFVQEGPSVSAGRVAGGVDNPWTTRGQTWTNVDDAWTDTAVRGQPDRAPCLLSCSSLTATRNGVTRHA